MTDDKDATPADVHRRQEQLIRDGYEEHDMPAEEAKRRAHETVDAQDSTVTAREQDDTEREE
jgi:hypothetical protein